MSLVIFPYETSPYGQTILKGNRETSFKGKEHEWVTSRLMIKIVNP